MLYKCNITSFKKLFKLTIMKTRLCFKLCFFVIFIIALSTGCQKEVANDTTQAKRDLPKKYWLWFQT